MPKTQNAAKRPITLDELASGNRTVITIEEAAGALRLKRTATYEAVRRGSTGPAPLRARAGVASLAQWRVSRS
jgi:hypothetical protein